MTFEEFDMLTKEQQERLLGIIPSNKYLLLMEVSEDKSFTEYCKCIGVDYDNLPVMKQYEVALEYHVLFNTLPQ